MTMTMTMTMSSETCEEETSGADCGNECRSRACPRGERSGSGINRPQWSCNALTKTVIQTAQNEEMIEHLGYEKRMIQPGVIPATFALELERKRFRTDSARSIGIEASRDRAGTFERVIAGKRQGRLGEAR